MCNEFETRQPTMKRLKTSMTNATYTKPLQVLTYVRSATHSRFGAAAVKLRSTRSAGRVSDLCADRGDAFAFTAHDALEVQIVHEPGHPVTSDLDAFTIELAPDLLDPVHAEVVAVHASDLDLQLLVTSLRPMAVRASAA